MAKDLIKKMPFSIEAEQALLGCILISDNAAGVICGTLKADAFYSIAHKTIYQTMLKLYLKNKPVDYVTVVTELEKANQLSEVGGVEYITTLTNAIPTAANFEHYGDIVKRDHVLRQLVLAGERISQIGYESDDMNEALKFAEKQIFDIGEQQNFSSLEQIGASLAEVMSKFELIARDRDALKGVRTGFHALDKVTNGLQKGDLILLAARPSVGKTSLAMNIVLNAALQGNSKCAVFSLEMPKVQLAQRSLCSCALVSMERALKGELSSDDWNLLWQAHKKIVESKIFVDDSSLNTPMDILSKCRKLKREQGLDLIMIDYLQLMNSGGKAKENRQQEISEMTRSLKIAAKELNVPILLLSQLSRAMETRTDHRPILSDLRESGAIEQDADIVMFIYNPDVYLADSALKQNIIDLIIAKHRNGPLETIKLKFTSEHTTFSNLNRDSDAQSLEKSLPNRGLKTNEVLKPLPPIVPLDDSDITDIF